MRRLASIAAMMIVLSACAPAQDAQLREDLRRASATTGLALVETFSGPIAVIPFDGAVKYLRSEYGRGSTVAVGKAGRMILWCGLVIPLRPLPDCVIETIGGDIVSKRQPPFPKFYPAALVEDARRLVFWGAADQKPEGLYWASFDLSAYGLVAADISDGDLAPNGHAVTYAKDGAVYLFDISSGSSKLLVPGSDPTWSPNGEWIAYRNREGHPSLITPSGSPANWPLTDFKPLGPLRWSPDGRYVSFVENNENQILYMTRFYRLVVCRVSDGKSITIRNFGSGDAGPHTSFYWIMDYRTFCPECQPGQPFD